MIVGVLILALGVLILTSDVLIVGPVILGVLMLGVEMVPFVGALVSAPLRPITPVANKIPKIKLARASKPKSPQQTGPHQLPLAFY